MTKRFIADGMRVWDLENKIPSILTHNEEQQQKYLNELNRLHEELQKCKQYNTILYQNSTQNNREYLKQITKLEKENEHIKETIIRMLENERTELGQSVLKQLQARIQE